MDSSPIDLTDFGQEKPQPAHDPLPPIKRGGGSLLIAIIVSALFLLGALGIAAWMYMQRQNTPSVAQPKDTSSTKDVKSVTWVAPAVPANYTPQSANTHDATTTYYYDDATTCGLTTTVTPVTDTQGATAKDAVLNLTKAGAISGVTVDTTTDGAGYTIKDTTAKEYPFDSLEITQNVNVQNIDFKKKNNIVAYKQFGTQLAVITATCKEDTWDTTKVELEGLLKQFTVKLER